MAHTNKRYNSYGAFLQQQFGHRVHKIPINAGFTCPNRDGKVAFGGCTYCNIDSFTPEAARARIPVRQQLENAIGYLKKRFKAQAFLAYFQPYSNTYAPLYHLRDLYEQALEHPQVVGISIGTRPDCMEQDKLRYLASLARDYFVTVEYGIESVHDATLQTINRGHDFACTVDAIRRSAGRGIYICGHVIFGFPNESKQQMFETVAEVCKLPLDFIKLHNLHIVRYTELARQFRMEPFSTFSFEEWIDFVTQVIERLNPAIKIERLYGDAPRHLLIEPQWCREKSAAEVTYAVQQCLRQRKTHQGRLYRPDPNTGVELDNHKPALNSGIIEHQGI